ncbi:ATP-binding protein [Desulfurivibrio alkaliphilus]|uniref:ATPase (AAA+ superfamily)-like protein n=1 Tax=Desulfurivibrio alkaliphilus (strain DSM 19089 / UNIQEM U267 / AHT2) TaxID=589865 RepID=D6Z3H1_DESAT|nr:ATP-binding protein [Desulfurivibrio alkaliphilus]ADH86096.1 ATPase (AAA+ superfamily)-like protein [Desulfurivibrio alkaliphilus AHT 2]
MIPRILQPILKKLAGQYPVVTVTGPRQSGKTTLCRAVFPDYAYVNLEMPDLREFARTDPRGFLASHPKGLILDEVQRVPELSSYLQALVDQSREPGRFILTGSQQFEVMSTITQSLAGRTTLLKLLPLSMEELAQAKIETGIDQTLLTGFYPRIYDAGLDPTRTLGDYMETYVERDIRQLMAIKDLALFEKFVRLCAGRVGQLLNLQSLGNDTGVSHTTARSWLTLLEASYVVFLLQPWHVNISKRQVKTPKLYFYDVGLASYLLGAENELHINRHPLKGNLFENMVVVEALKYRFNRGKRSNLYFWRDVRGNEVDLLLAAGPDLFPVEIKAGATISGDYFKGLQTFAAKAPTPPTASALVYAGEENQRRSKVSVWPAQEVAAMMRSFKL